MAPRLQRSRVGEPRSSLLQVNGQATRRPTAPSINIEPPSDNGNEPLLQSKSQRSPRTDLLLPHSPPSHASFTDGLSIQRPPPQIIEDPPLADVKPSPADISYTLKIVYNHKSAVYPKVSSDQGFDWDSPEAYVELRARILATEDTLKENGRILRLDCGSVKVTGRYDQLSESINDLDNIYETTYKLICGFIFRHSRQKFWLAFYFEYSSPEIEPKNGDKYIMMVKNACELLLSRNTNIDKQGFVPKRDRNRFAALIHDIISEDAGQDASDMLTLADDIIKAGATGLFLACITSPLYTLEDFKTLFRQGYNDANLPQSSSNPNPARHNDEDFHDLVKRIHQFFAKTIDGQGRHWDLLDHEVMPILHVKSSSLERSTSKTSLGTGAFGEVWKVKINSAHHKMIEDGDSYFALKKFETKHAGAFRKEVAMLRQLRNQTHPHITPHLMSWSQDDSCYILYPLATCNLRTYMTQHQPPTLTLPSMKWFLRQVHGLVSALAHVHEQLKDDDELRDSLSNDPNQRNGHEAATRGWSGFHHDVKPENILIFEIFPGINPVMKLSDFGAGKFSELTKDLQSNQASVLRGTTTYFGPEYKGRRSRPFDIWAMACVLTELLIWFIEDSGLNNFHSDRMQQVAPNTSTDHYFQVEGATTTLKPVVREYLEKMKTLINNGAEDTRTLAKLPHIILGCFEIDPLRRPAAKVLQKSLDDLLEAARITPNEKINIDATTNNTDHEILRGR